MKYWLIVLSALGMLAVTGCAKEYSLQQDWDHLDYDRITKPAKKS